MYVLFSMACVEFLYEHMVKFKPQYVAFFASNGPIPIAMDNAARDRTAIVDHVSIFKDAPSPTFAPVRGRRIVCVREVPKDAKILPGVYKRFTDPFSEISGRNLYEHMVKFKPQYLAFFAINGPIPIAMDNAVRDRTAIVDHVSIFKDKPSESNDLQWKDMLSLIPKYRPGIFWLLRRAYHHFLKSRPRRNVAHPAR